MIHEGAFVRIAARAGEGTSPLVGSGSVEVTHEGLRIRARAARTTLVTVLSGVAGTGLMLVMIIAGVMIGEELAWDVEPRLMVALGLAGLAGWFFAAEAILSRVMPARSFDHVVRFSYLLSGAATGAGAEVLCTDPACAGRFGFQTANVAGLLAELEAKRPR